MTSPVKVAHVLGALNYGGVESLALDLLHRFPGNVIQSSVYYIGERLTERQRDFAGAAAEFVHCPYVPPHRIRFIRQLAMKLRQSGVDAVLSYSFGNHAWVSMAAYLAGTRRAYVTVQGSPMRDRPTRRKSFILTQLARPFCSGEIAASNQVHDELVNGLRVPRARVQVIENACAVREIAELAARARRQKPAGGPPVVTMVSRMDDAKDHNTLIRACAILMRSGFPVRLRFAGAGPNRTAHESFCWREGVREHVEFLGNRTDVPELLGSSDLAVLATHTEGFGLVLAEAMSAKTPVIATDLPVCREVLDFGRCGLLVPPRDPDALAAAIHRLLADDALRNQLIDAGFERASRKYDISRAVDQYARLLAGITEKESK